MNTCDICEKEVQGRYIRDVEGQEFSICIECHEALIKKGVNNIYLLQEILNKEENDGHENRQNLHGKGAD